MYKRVLHVELNEMRWREVRQFCRTHRMCN